ncbi:hypothetical protein GJ654_12470 [Rhodoblastus acidophilus]|uniref:Uncharacterized protein n=1 Tax=Rhodoblastus acidophilus TaxID=1074 RepID=A0A6N8DMP3_RHOAC|nr:hypothetical protein [Rhodoblastus acidophilus]MCW2275307.1 hypothetical protein [Rhodoblastus acidophilus]MTV31800.1 hypothetical protein [Rhodoblastus acidophilus]
MPKPLISYTIPLLKLDALRNNDFRLSPLEVGFFERLGTRAVQFSDVFDALLAIAFTCAKAEAEASAHAVSAACLAGIRIAMRDLIALTAARPASSETEIVRKIMIDRCIAQQDDDSNLTALLSASIRLDIERMNPDFTVEEVELWIEAKHSQAET